MSVHTLNKSVNQPLSHQITTPFAQNTSSPVLNADQELPANVVNIRSARKAQEKAQQELMDYLLWTMKHDMDPHRLYDDPIEVFRAELKAVVGLV